MSNPFKSRIRRVRRMLSAQKKPCALLLSSAPIASRSRDTDYPYRQHSDFYYLTGTRRQGAALLVSSESSIPLLLTRRDDKERVVWEGKAEDVRAIAERCGAQLIGADDPAKEARSRLQGHEALFYQNTPGSIAWRVARELLELPSWRRRGLPASFHHSDLLLEPLRVRKDREELALMARAIEITCSALRGVLPLVSAGATEAEISAALEYGFRLRGGEPAFASIVAAGPSAATLHYEKLGRTLRQSDMLLIDCGAEHEMYCADITRVFPVSGRFRGAQREVYDVVLAAQKAVLRRVRDGVRVDTLYGAAVRVLTEGLVELGVLRGRVSRLIEQEAYRPYFPHSIGHMLGLDTHDLGRMRGDREAALKKGMVITVEPGLYFARRAGSVPACGVRIEDDVLVTAEGARVLSKGFPKETAEIEAMMDF